MSSYSNVTPRIIDSVFDRANGRLEFRLPAGNVYLSSFRLINIGVNATPATTKYNPVLGALAAIKSITLFDGAEQLDTLRLAPLLNSLKHLNKRNDENLSMNRFLKHIGLGYVANGTYGIATNAFTKDGVKVAEQNPQSNTAGDKAWISLKDLLSFLGASLVVPTTLFKQLRLVIEYNSATEAAKYLDSDNATAVSTTSDALLLVDEVNEGDMKSMLMKNYQGVVYRPLETDQVVVPTTGAGADTAADAQPSQSNNFLMNGFNNKKLRRVMIVNAPTDSSTWYDTNALQGYGELASVASWKSNVQLRVNGANKLPASGIGSSADGSVGNRRLAKLVDTWGDFNIIPGQQFTQFPGSANYIANGSLVGQQDIFGCEVQEHIRELQVQFDRTGIFGNAKTTQPLNLVVVGEVEKALTLSGDRYIIQYV